MKKKLVRLVFGVLLLPVTLQAQAQQLPKIPRIGFIASASQEAVLTLSPSEQD
jgi:hypothetical protein